MELPTYTNIWKIEKRLYKLYDFRLPMPLPVGQMAAYLAIAVPYMIILTLAGVPFSHTWLWIYLLPPGVLAWLVTRPVLEGKRLPELVLSQLRYLSEPRTWCRLSPLAEKDDIVLVARVWRSAAYVRPAPQPVPAARPASAVQLAMVPAEVTAPQPAQQPERARRATRQRASRQSAAMQRASAGPALGGPALGGAALGGAALTGAALGESASAGSPAGEPDRVQPEFRRRTAREKIPVRARAAEAAPQMTTRRAQATAPAQPAWPANPLQAAQSAEPAQPAAPAQPAQAVQPAQAAPSSSVQSAEAVAAQPVWPAHPAQSAVPVQPPPPGPPSPPAQPGQAPAPPQPEAKRPAVRVTGDASAARPLNVVERALRTQPGATGFRDHVVVVPGGHRPGKPDQVQRDQARARLPLAGPVRIVVLGCTAGAGQTVTTLLTGQLLASLRGEAVAVVDLNPGAQSLTQQARFVPALMPSRLAGADPRLAANAGERGLQVVTASDSTDDPGQIISAVAARYPLTLADPEASCVPRTLRAADQLILVVPASAEAPGSLAVTLEWLEAHDHSALAAGAITVLNGVNPQSAAHAERAAAVASGRSRAIVRVPWDQRVQGRQALGTAAVQAYTALAGVLIASVADAAAQPGRGR